MSTFTIKYLKDKSKKFELKTTSSSTDPTNYNYYLSKIRNHVGVSNGSILYDTGGIDVNNFVADAKYVFEYDDIGKCSSLYSLLII